MATQTINYASPATITVSPASLATSSTFVAGRESNEIDNSTNKYVDALVTGKVTVGTTPTINTQILVYVWGADVAPSATPIDVIDGVDSAETLTSVGVGNGFLKLAAQLDVDATTSDRTYPVGPFSVAQLFGGVMPKFWGLFLAHNTGVSLHATGGNHAFTYTGIKYDVA